MMIESPSRRPARRPTYAGRKRLLHLAAAAVLPLSSIASANSIWQANPVTPADWFTPGNWAGGVPTTGIVVEINNGGTAQISSGTAQSSTLLLANTAGSSGNLSL